MCIDKIISKEKYHTRSFLVQSPYITLCNRISAVSGYNKHGGYLTTRSIIDTDGREPFLNTFCILRNNTSNIYTRIV